jgi:transcriptional regulator with XRE-family HTH domain
MDLHVNRGRLDLELVRRNWTQADLARLLGVSRTAISLFFQGKQMPPRLAARIAQAMGVPLDDVLTPK